MKNRNCIIFIDSTHKNYEYFTPVSLLKMKRKQNLIIKLIQIRGAVRTIYLQYLLSLAYIYNTSMLNKRCFFLKKKWKIIFPLTLDPVEVFEQWHKSDLVINFQEVWFTISQSFMSEIDSSHPNYSIALNSSNRWKEKENKTW